MKHQSWILLASQLTFKHPSGDKEVSLLPELVTLAEVAAEVVLVLHHVLGDAEADGGGRGRGQHSRQTILSAGVVVTRLKQQC